MNVDNITHDLTKHYLTEEPFFIQDSAGTINILRPAGFWNNPSEYSRRA